MMQKLFPRVLISLMILITYFPVAAEEGKGGAYYDFGVFAYEDEHYEDAETNFRKALELDPENTLYMYHLGKTCLKIGRFQDAGEFLGGAWAKDPDIPGLKYDLAFLNFKISEYEKAGELFTEMVKAEPENVLASYYAGICLYKLGSYKTASQYLVSAAEKSPTILSNAYYYAGICHEKAGETRKALEKFEYVRDHADSESLKTNAVKWLEAIHRKEKLLKPYNLYLRIGRRYDDNVSLLDLDDDQYSEKDDYVSVVYFAGQYKFVNNANCQFGLGYSHYQTWHDDMSEYDLTGSIFSLYAKYRFNSLTLGFDYIPSYYWADSESYLRRHQLKPHITWEINESLAGRLSYSHYNDDYLGNDDRSGNLNDISFDLYYTFPSGKGTLFGGLGYEKNAAHPDYDYARFKGKLGMSLHMPWSLNLGLTGRYYDKEYDNADSEYGITRDDGRYVASLSLSRPLFYDWLTIDAEFSYTKNDSNISDYDYEKKVTALSLTARY